jgi:DNA-binding XRE family transcriptional regulator
VKDRRERLAAVPYKSSLYENAANLCQAIYQRNGPGHRRMWVRWDPCRVPDIRGWLEERLGTLAYFESELAQPEPSAEVPLGRHENGAFRNGSPELPPEHDPVELPIAAETAAVEALATVPVAFSDKDELIEPVVVPLAAAVEALPPATLGYRGGLLPKEVRNWSRDGRRAAGISQEALARLIRISRPQLANAEAGRFGLSPEAAERLLAAIASLPVRQPSLLWSAP